MINYKKSFGEKFFDAANHIFMILIMIVTLYPCYYVLVASVSDPMQLYNGSGILLFPQGFDIGVYADVFEYKQLWVGYRNTIFYVLVGGGLSVVVTVMAAFALTRRELPFKNTIMMCIVFTMYFSGGLIPTYLVVKGVGILDTPLAMILPGLVSAYNLIITISYFKGLPYELEEAAKIDGASDYTILGKIMIPLAKPIIAVISLYYMVALWNNYFSAMIYLQEPSLYPLQLILRDILISNDTASIGSGSNAGDAQSYAENLKYAIIVVSTVPILCLYPYIQKFFVKGVTIGAVKG